VTVCAVCVAYFMRAESLSNGSRASKEWRFINAVCEQTRFTLNQNIICRVFYDTYLPCFVMIANINKWCVNKKKQTHTDCRSLIYFYFMISHLFILKIAPSLYSLTVLFLTKFVKDNFLGLIVNSLLVAQNYTYVVSLIARFFFLLKKQPLKLCGAPFSQKNNLMEP